jgi:hypothetical protein
MTIRTDITAGALTTNHNQTRRGGLTRRTSVMAGIFGLRPNHNETLRGIRLRTAVRAVSGTRPNHNETLRAGLKPRTSARARELTRGARALTAGLAATVVLAEPAQAQPTFLLNFTCDLGGAPARLAMEVEVVQGGGGVVERTGHVIPTGEVSYFYQGTLTSATGRYTFHGENEFADFVDQLTNDRFPVRLIGQGEQLLMIINPYGPGPAQHLCRLSDGQPH